MLSPYYNILFSLAHMKGTATASAPERKSQIPAVARSGYWMLSSYYNILFSLARTKGTVTRHAIEASWLKKRLSVRFLVVSCFYLDHVASMRASS